MARLRQVDIPPNDAAPPIPADYLERWVHRFMLFDHMDRADAERRAREFWESRPPGERDAHLHLAADSERSPDLPADRPEDTTSNTGERNTR